MNTAQSIRDAVAEVERLRAETRANPEIGRSAGAVKRLQARRFAGTYSDLLVSQAYGSATRFFLEELYGERDFAERDAQFARIAGAVERLFPRDVAETAAALARLHGLTESLDHGMARTGELQSADDVAGYVRAWKAVGRREDRREQLRAVLAMGSEMSRLTRLPGLRMMLRMMRGPAAAAGLSSLQRFLESGFDIFSGISKQRGGAERFLQTIEERESLLMNALFDGDLASAEGALAQALARSAA